ncbi:hypothetical protein HKD37_08G022767 [Glycine soja]
MQVTLSHHKSTKSTIKNLEVQMDQLAKQMAERPTGTFVANTKKNPKEECKEIVTRSQKKKDAEVGRVLQDKSIKEGDDTKREEEDDGKEKDAEVLIPKTKSQFAWEARKEITPALLKEALYLLVPSKKDKERYFKRFLDIFQKLEILIPFGEALQQMPLYIKFLKDLLTKKGKYISNETVATCPSRASEGEAHGCAFQRRKDARSRHQRLFVGNVGKTEGNRSTKAGLLLLRTLLWRENQTYVVLSYA